MPIPSQTTGVFYYQYPEHVDRTDTLAEREKLAETAAVEPILQRWRHRCSDGLIDDAGKIRNVFTKVAPGAEDNVSQVIRELNRVPEAVTELQAALEAQLALNALARHLVEMPVRDEQCVEFGERVEVDLTAWAGDHRALLEGIEQDRVCQ